MRKACIAAGIGLIFVAGCGHDEKPKPLAPAAFTGANRRIATDPQSAVDQPGALPVEGTRTRIGEPDQPRQPAGPGAEKLSNTVQENVKSPGAVAAERAATQGAPRALASTQGASSGQYMTIGGVVAEVNGTPIYANRVLSTLEPVLAARAQQLDERQFKVFAKDELGRQIMEFCYAEREVAAAQRFLDEKDKQLADALTAQWRTRQITESGGSLELARKNAPDIARLNHLPEDLSFDDMVTYRHRLYLTQLYYERKVMPRIAPSAAEMRAYYDHNAAKLFTEHEAAQFRIIKIDPKDMGGKEQALAKITDLRNRAVSGEDFAEMAGSINHDPRLLKAKGDITGGLAQRGLSAPLDKVEDAVWQLQPGQITEIIESGGAFYIAKLEQRKPGRVAPFEEEATQDKIRADLRSEQFRALREQVQKKLLEDAVVRSTEEMRAIALEMAMERYPRWAAAK